MTKEDLETSVRGWEQWISSRRTGMATALALGSRGVCIRHVYQDLAGKKGWDGVWRTPGVVVELA